MSLLDYEKAKKLGEKQVRNDLQKGRSPYLPVLDEIIDREDIVSEVNLGLINIPLNRIVGTSTAGRTQAFASNFMPIMDYKSEFSQKWIRLSDAHVAEGIRDPIKVYEYLNYFYVVEGNKRVSVLKYYDADSIPAMVTRKVPKLSDDKEIKIYYEFMDFYKKTGVNTIWFTQEGSFEKLIHEVSGDRTAEDNGVSSVFGANESIDGKAVSTRKEVSKVWDEDTVLGVRAAYLRFEGAFKERKGDKLWHITTGDAFLAFLEVHGFEAVDEMSHEDMSVAIKEMWQEFLVMEESYEVQVSLMPPETKKSLISQLLPQYSQAKPLKVAFIYDREPDLSDWLYAHELGRNHIKEVFGDKLVTLKVSTAGTEEEAIEAMEELIEKQNVELIFTTTTRLIDASLRCAIKHKNVKILNCSLNTSHRYIRTYYARLYEAKFLVGILAGILTQTDKIGYVADYPIFGNVANINAFALGVAMVNPRAQVILKWTTLKNGGSMEQIYEDLTKEGVDYISDQDMITPKHASRRFGLYQLTDGEPVNVAMPVINWGVLYETLISYVLDSAWDSADSDTESKPINYWWGLSSRVVDIILSNKVTPQTKRLIDNLKSQIIRNRFIPFSGEIVSQDDVIRNADNEELEIDDIIRMDWLVKNVTGFIPTKEDLKERAQPIVELKGVKHEENEDITSG